MVEGKLAQSDFEQWGKKTKKSEIIQGCRLYWMCGQMSVDGTLCINWQRRSANCQQLAIQLGKMVSMEYHGRGDPGSK